MTRDEREWLESDGLGGFAMGCADGIRTRRYHGTLLVATRPPEGRMLLVADLEVYAETPAGRFGLSSHDYNRGYLHPDGATRIASFAYRPWPTWEWLLPDGTRLRGELVVPHGRPATMLRWTKLAGPAGDAVFLHVRPMLAPRDYHSTHHANPAFRFEPETAGERVTWRPYDGVPAIHAIANGLYQHSPDWYRDVYYAMEDRRGLPCMEDLASPGEFTFDLSQPAALALSIDADVAVGLAGSPSAAARVEAVFASERTRRARFASPLDLSADAYVVQRGAGQTVIAGYPWFSDWGRDTFISLRGLCLATGRFDVARRVLLEWSGVVSDGMLPNRFDEGNASPEYNSVDAALWYVIAADAYIQAASATGDDRAKLERAIDAIVAGYAAGTRHRIRCDDDGLIAAGEHGFQLTWMDAKLGDWVVTPRIGKPVEIQALWINALAIAGRRTAKWRDLCEKARASFVERFWNHDAGQLYDVVDCDHSPGALDGACRPNQVFAIGGLPLAVLDGERAKRVVDAAFAALWTPAGPRSLAEGDPRYSPTYGGGAADRDRVYHNGPVWPWLVGPFVEAWVRVRGNTADAKRDARARFLDPLMTRLEIAGLGHIAEICEGGSPHTPVGCPFQAWSLAELIRLDRVVLR
jgi:predicted glycogen debranching enzyme|nr:amylo-alpha-1,6-glucosidase [Kofleriaceae bacterium]